MELKTAFQSSKLNNMSPASTLPNVREHLLSLGEAAVLKQGFTALDRAAFLDRAGVRADAFERDFASWDAFGVALLQRYFLAYDLWQEGLLTRGQGTMRERLLAYFHAWYELYARGRDSLDVRLSGEAADLSEAMLKALSEGMNQVIRRLSDTLRRGQMEGSLPCMLSAEPFAQMLYGLWLGSSQLSRVQQSPHALEIALAQTDALLAQGCVH